MLDSVRREGAWQRARGDTIGALRSVRFLLVQAPLIALAGSATLLAQDQDLKILIGFLAAVGAELLTVGAIFVFSLLAAPLRQRNELLAIIIDAMEPEAPQGIAVRPRSGDPITLLQTGEMRATIAVSSFDTPLNKCSVRLVEIETVDTFDPVTQRVQPCYLQWARSEPGVSGPGREFLDIAPIPGDEHVIDIAIVRIPRGFKTARSGDDVENLPDWSFRLASATEHHKFHEGWYKAKLRISADDGLSHEFTIALGLRKEGLGAYLRIDYWDAIGETLPKVPQWIREGPGPPIEVHPERFVPPEQSDAQDY